MTSDVNGQISVTKSGNSKRRRSKNLPGNLWLVKLIKSRQEEFRRLISEIYSVELDEETGRLIPLTQELQLLIGGAYPLLFELLNSYALHRSCAEAVDKAIKQAGEIGGQQVNVAR
jgi:hypothetical protein